MEIDPDLVELKTKLLNLVGNSNFPNVLRESTKAYLGEELLGYRLLTSEGKIEHYQWNTHSSEFEIVGSTEEVDAYEGMMDLSSVQQFENLQLVVENREEIGSVLYRSICYHHLLNKNTDEQPFFEQLTHREKQILRELISGADNKKIATKFGIGYRTVEKHCENIYHKLGVEHRNSLLRLRIRFDESLS